MAEKNKKVAGKRTGKRSTRFELANEIQGVAFIAIGAFLFISLVLNQDSILRRYIAPLLLGAFGILAYVLPLFIIFIGICRIALKKITLHTGKTITTVFMLLSFIGLLHIALAGSQTIESASNFGNAISLSFELGKERLGAGAAAALFVFPLSKLLTLAGTVICFAAIIIVAVILLFNLSLRQAGEKVKSGIDSAVEHHRKRIAAYDDDLKKERREEKEARELEDSIIDDFPGHTAKPVQQELPLRRGITVKTYGQDGSETDVIEMGEDEKDAKEEKHETPKVQKKYVFPPINLLNAPQPVRRQLKVDHSAKIEMLESTLRSFGINAWVENITQGPAITRYELSIEKGTRVSKILSLSDDIALSMAAAGVRIEAPIPGKSAIGIEIPNETVSMVTLREVIDTEAFRSSKSKVSVALGKDITGAPIISDLSKMPHLLIAGQTGSGKSVCINSIITSILYKATPQEVRLILVDPKKVELNVYNGIPHLLTPVVTDPKRAAGALQFVVRKMEERYEAFARKKVKEISRYNEVAIENGEEPMCRLVVIVDELNDLMLVARGEVEDSVIRIAQLARAAGIYLILATQRPSVNVITGVIKANIPSRIAFAVASAYDSKTILDSMGAEKLVGKGDMLFHMSGESKPTRIQGAFVGEQEVERVVEAIKASQCDVDYIGDEQLIMRELKPVGRGGGERMDDEEDDNSGDDLFPAAVEYGIECGSISISALQRRFKIGYSRAGRLIDDMEIRHIVGPAQGAKAREILVTREEFWERYNKE